MNVKNSMGFIVFAAMGAIAGLDGVSSVHAQTPGQIAAQQIRNQAVAKAMQDRGITLPQSQYGINHSHHLHSQSKHVPHQRYPSYRPGYSSGFGATYYSGNQYVYPQSYGYPQSYSGYGYGYGAPAYGYGYGLPVYQYRTVPNRSSSNSQSNRLPGSNYFGDPHASQYFGP